MMAGQPGRAYRLRAAELLNLVNLSPRAGHRPKELSGGEQQRVAIARALVNEPAIIYADEPTANLDTRSAQTVMQTLQRLNRTLGVTVVLCPMTRTMRSTPAISSTSATAAQP